MTELLGYLASALVVLSLTMRSLLRLRIISLCGSTSFLIYGALIESVPVMVTNGSIALINLWFLTKEFRIRRSGHGDLGASRIRIDSPFLCDFVEHHLADIRRFQPEFTMPTPEGGDADLVAFMLTRDGLPAGLIIARHRDDTLWIDLDYVLREHRDSRLGRWLFGAGADAFREMDVRRIVAEASTDPHRRYLTGIGFTPSATGPTGDFELRL
ncbi:MAG: GNAT family N-acetyltransferase [Actinomycetota bacterium]